MTPAQRALLTAKEVAALNICEGWGHLAVAFDVGTPTVTGFQVHGSDFDAFGRCRLTPWVTAAPVVWGAE